MEKKGRLARVTSLILFIHNVSTEVMSLGAERPKTAFEVLRKAGDQKEPLQRITDADCGARILHVQITARAS